MYRNSTSSSRSSLNTAAHYKSRRAARALFEAVEKRLLMSTYTVNTTADPTTTVAGQLSFREAVMMAQADGTSDTIQFDPTVFTAGSQHVVLLTEGPVSISDPAGLSISGPGATTVAISADSSGRIFSISAGSTVSVSGVTLTGGQQFLSESNFNTVGGAILNAGSLTIQNAILSGNSVQASTYYSVNGGEAIPGFGLGGAIYSTGSLNISNSSLSDNSVINTAQAGPDEPVAGGSSFGGAIYSRGTLILTSDSFSGNSVTGFDGSKTTQSTTNGGDAEGGAIYSAASGTISLNNSTISGNTATGGDTDPTYTSGTAGNAQGAGVYIGQISVTLSNDVITGNSAIAGSSGLDSGRSGGASGAGVYVAGTLTLSNSTVSSNTATSDSNYVANPSEGGGVYADNGVTLQSDTIESNSVEGGPALLGSSLPSSAGGGVFAGSYAQVVSTTIANNSITSVTSPFGEPGGVSLGGGLYAGSGYSGTLPSYIFDSTISGNSAEGGHGYDDAIGDYLPAGGGNASGGGVYSLTALTVANSTIVNNSAAGGIGGAAATQGIPENGAMGGSAIGGGIDADSLVVTDSTITGNTTTGGAGGAASPSTGYTNGSTGVASGGGVAATSATFTNSIISGDTAGGAPQDLSLSSTSGDAYDLVGVGGGLVNGQSGNIVGVTSPDLSVLGNYGGSTETMVPQTGSPAIDAGSNSLIPAGTTTDQRGLPRISNGTLDIGSVEVQVAATKLTGTVIGTSGSYLNDGNTIAEAFDGNLSTFYDGASANGNYLGLNLGASDIITQISYAPRSGWASRMVGGVFQGANNASFSGATTLYTITSAPAQGVLTTVSIANSTAFQYLRYLSPTSSYGNVAELDFYGTVGTTSSSKLTGTVIGTSGSYQNDGNTISKAFDGSLTDYFDGPTANGNVAGLDLGSPQVVTNLAYDPRSGFAGRMVGGIFQGANNADFSDAVTLYTVTTAPASDALTTVAVSNPSAYRYVRYLSPSGSYGDVGELAFYGYTPYGSVKVLSNGTLLITGTTGGDNISADYSIDEAQPSTTSSWSVSLNGVNYNQNGGYIATVVIDSFSGNDTISFNGSEAYDGGTAQMLTLAINAGSGNDDITTYIDNPDYEVTVDTTIVAGDGNDTVKADGGDATQISLGNGTDGVQTDSVAQLLNSTVAAGNGNDTVIAGGAGNGGQFFTFSIGSGQDEVINGDVDDHVSGVVASQQISLQTLEGIITGYVYADTNGDGKYESGEPTFANVPVHSSIGDTTTNSAGQYTLDYLFDGDPMNITVQLSGQSIGLSSGVLLTQIDIPMSSIYAQLSGTVIGTAGSYDNDGNTVSKAFDGSLTDYFDGPTANGDYAGLNLGSAKVITSVAYDPRTGFANRMVGGVFHGSNNASFSNATTLYTITAAPASDTLTTINISNTNSFEFVRYLAPAGSYGDVGELAFYGYSPTVTQVTGTVIGTAGSYQNDGNTIANVFDGSLSTYFDAPTGTGSWAGLDLGSAQVVTQVSYAPRAGWTSRMVGGEIQASNSANFSSGVVTLFTISQTPTAGVLTTQALSNTTAYRYYRYIGPASGFCNIAELDLFV